MGAGPADRLSSAVPFTSVSRRAVPWTVSGARCRACRAVIAVGPRAALGRALPRSLDSRTTGRAGARTARTMQRDSALPRQKAQLQEIPVACQSVWSIEIEPNSCITSRREACAAH